MKIYTGYEDGLICSWSIPTDKSDDKKSELIAPLIGHTNRINAIVGTDTKFIITTSNDCTVRQWDYDTGVCIAVFKFADPISACKISP
jgi:WD40 repeat protein